jgi:hypothetical protein
MAKFSYHGVASRKQEGLRQARRKSGLKEIQQVGLMHSDQKPAAAAILRKPAGHRRHLRFSGQGGCQKATVLVQT